MAMARWSLPVACPADQHDVALLGHEATTSKVIHERLVDRGAFELEVIGAAAPRLSANWHAKARSDNPRDGATPLVRPQ